MTARTATLGSGGWFLSSTGYSTSSQRTATLGSGGWFLMLLLSILFSLIMGMALTWLSIDRSDTAYLIERIQKQTDAARAHVAKLEVERDSLLSPYVLGQTAEQLGMTMANPGQIRRIESSRKR